MNQNLTTPRLLLMTILFFGGVLVGVGAADLMWRLTHVHGLGWVRPQRGLEFVLIAIACSLSGGALGVAWAGFDLLPGDDSSETK